jgi:hypothetical protein
LYFILLAVRFSNFIVVKDLDVARGARIVRIEHENEVYLVRKNLGRVRVIEHSWKVRLALAGSFAE